MTRADSISKVAGGAQPDDSLLLYSVATKHYVERKSNLQIARELGISRFRVARLLDVGLKSGVIEPRVSLPGVQNRTMGTELVNAFGLNQAVVSSATGDDKWRADMTAALAVSHTASLLHDGDSLGISWGRTMDAVTNAAAHLDVRFPRVDVVQLVGGVPSESGSLEASDLVRRFAGMTGGRGIVLNAPLLVPDEKIAAGLRREKSVADAFRAGADSDVALFSVGSWKRGLSGLREALTPHERKDAKASGVTADVCGILLNDQGQEVESFLGPRVVTLGAMSLRQVPRRVGVVLEVGKADALKSVLLSGLITDIVIAEDSAKQLLRWAGK